MHTVTSYHSIINDSYFGNCAVSWRSPFHHKLVVSLPFSVQLASPRPSFGTSSVLSISFPLHFSSTGLSPAAWLIRFLVQSSPFSTNFCTTLSRPAEEWPNLVRKKRTRELHRNDTHKKGNGPCKLPMKGTRTSWWIVEMLCVSDWDVWLKIWRRAGDRVKTGPRCSASLLAESGSRPRTIAQSTPRPLPDN